MHWAYWIVVAFAAILSLYIYSYYKYPAAVEVHQTSLHNFTFDMLRAKQPLVIDDRVVKLDDLQRLWFSSNITKSFALMGGDAWHSNKFKYLIMHAEQEGDIYLYPPGKKMVDGNVPDPNESLLAVHLLPGQVLVIPYHWRYLIMQPMQVGCLGVHDYITYILP